jgi:signal transduction histidine kinase
VAIAGESGESPAWAERIAQEALGNALRHAEAGRIDVRLDSGSGRLTLSVSDDGCGFDPAAARGQRLGLTSMEERAKELGGTLAVESSEAGTTVRLEVPA